MLDHFWQKRICELTAFLGIAIFLLYIWFTFLAHKPPIYELSMLTVVLASLTTLTAVVCRFLTNQKGAWVRSLICYLLLIVTIIFLLADSGGINSPYIFLWVLTASFAGVFGILSSAPVFTLAIGYFIFAYLQDMIADDSLLPTIFVIITPIIFSVIAWSQMETNNRQGSAKSKPRMPGVRSSEISSLSEESSTLINAIGDGVLVLNSQNLIEIINPAAEQMLGWAHGDALNLSYKSVLKITDQNDQDLVDELDPIQQTLNTNQNHRSSNLKIETKSGKKLFVSLVVSPLGQTGSGVVVVLRDITKERAEEREQAEFISTASHEMRTPVASIEGYLGLALNPNTAQIDEKARDFINKAHQAAQHLGRLFQDLLDISRAEDGRLSNNPSVFDLTDFIGQVVESLQPQAAQKNIDLIFAANSPNAQRGERTLTPVFLVNLDKDHAREIVANLVENAIKYTPSGQVVVDIKGEKDNAVISIQDSGIGIPSEDLPHLFQKFYRVDNSDTREIGGTGLGLYLCRRLVESIGGRIWAESVYKQGSTFFVELPRIDARQAESLRAEQQKTTVPEQAVVSTDLTAEVINTNTAPVNSNLSPVSTNATAVGQQANPSVVNPVDYTQTQTVTAASNVVALPPTEINQQSPDFQAQVVPSANQNPSMVSVPVTDLNTPITPAREWQNQTNTVPPQITPTTPIATTNTPSAAATAQTTYPTPAVAPNMDQNLTNPVNNSQETIAAPEPVYYQPDQPLVQSDTNSTNQPTAPINIPVQTNDAPSQTQ